MAVTIDSIVSRFGPKGSPGNIEVAMGPICHTIKSTVAVKGIEKMEIKKNYLIKIDSWTWDDVK